MSNKIGTEIEICVHIAEFVENKIDFVTPVDEWLMMSWLDLANGEIRFTLEYDFTDSDGANFYEFETEGRCHKIVGVPGSRDAWLKYPWPVRAFITSYNFMVEHALGSVGWIDNLIERERSAE